MLVSFQILRKSQSFTKEKLILFTNKQITCRKHKHAIKTTINNQEGTTTHHALICRAKRPAKLPNQPDGLDAEEHDIAGDPTLLKHRTLCHLNATDSSTKSNRYHRNTFRSTKFHRTTWPMKSICSNTAYIGLKKKRIPSDKAT